MVASEQHGELLLVSSGRKLQTAANFWAVHFSAEKQDCLRIARSSQDLGRLRAKPTARQSIDALASRDGSVTASGAGARPPGTRGPWHTPCPTAGPPQTLLPPRRQHSCGKLPVQRRFLPPLGRSWNKALIFQRLGGFCRAAGHPDRLICTPLLAAAFLGKPRAAKPLDPVRGSASNTGEKPHKSRGGSQLTPLPTQGGHSSTTWTPTDYQKGAAWPTASVLRGSDGMNWEEIVIKKVCSFAEQRFKNHLLEEFSPHYALRGLSPRQCHCSMHRVWLGIAWLEQKK